MRLSNFLSVIGVAGLSAVVTALVLRAGSDSNEATSAQERALQQENDRLHKVIDNLTVDLARMNGNPNPSSGAAAGTTPLSPPGVAPMAGTSSSDSNGGTAAGSALTPPASPDMASSADMPAESDNPTSEQSVFFEDMKQRLDDPAYVQALNLAQFTKMKQMETLPEAMKQELLSKVAQKFNSGEVDKKTFLSGMRGYSQ